ncbi:glycosyltransferase family 4 protein [Natranaerobius thermophilus]|uniref:Glycosyl transferase family 4 n=1 Tax=Natranaerobius thermophilus (strain ATCC BAA-1301 / DSM 18059 / JW/NM-WN-LF) TaxID=457570 RepID=B2A0R1_NATTJ|nr:MraY family glycosyltransferase [Natranaerobius thermophilus]ACB85941.1 glycosyl transferase family 4 [Natranaerobius thermophilus JW/NM-WN-LF]
MELYLKVAVTSAALSLIMTPLLRKISYKVGAVDQPKESRKIHNHVMPRLGGPAIFLSFLISLIMYVPLETEFYGLLMGSILILVIGMLDDIYGLSPLIKLGGQVAAVLVFIAFGNQVEFLTNPFDGLFYLGVLSIPVTVMWMVGVTNALNLIDGLDGLASGVSAIALTAFAIIAVQNEQMLVALTALALLGGILGFLKYNFYPAKIFLGDSGSLLLGYMISALSVMGLLKSVTMVTFIIPMLLLGVPILDTFFAILRRYWHKRPIFQADKGHLHHRLLNLGMSHKQAVLFIYLISVGFGIGAVLFFQNGTGF